MELEIDYLFVVDDYQWLSLSFFRAHCPTMTDMMENVAGKDRFFYIVEIMWFAANLINCMELHIMKLSGSVV